FEDKTMQRFAELEQRLTSQGKAMATPPVPSAPVPPPPLPPLRQTFPTQFPPQSALPTVTNSLPPPPPPRVSSPAGVSLNASQPGFSTEFPVPPLVRVSLSSDVNKGTPAGPSSARDSDANKATPDGWLPVSFTRGVLLGGLDAPTGGQSQSNPHP